MHVHQPLLGTVAAYKTFRLINGILPDFAIDARGSRFSKLSKFMVSGLWFTSRARVWHRLLWRATCWIQWHLHVHLAQLCGILRGSLGRSRPPPAPRVRVATPVLTPRTATSSTLSPRAPDAVFMPVRGAWRTNRDVDVRRQFLG